MCECGQKGNRMLPLYEDPCFPFRFADDRIILRFHLEGVEVGWRVSVFQIDPGAQERLGLLATATVGESSWVDLDKPNLYLIEWNQYTLDHMHPVYRKRCERDGLELESMRLHEDDRAPESRGPPVIEQRSLKAVVKQSSGSAISPRRAETVAEVTARRHIDVTDGRADERCWFEERAATQDTVILFINT
jgi:hypothetical protein